MYRSLRSRFIACMMLNADLQYDSHELPTLHDVAHICADCDDEQTVMELAEEQLNASSDIILWALTSIRQTLTNGVKVSVYPPEMRKTKPRKRKKGATSAQVVNRVALKILDDFCSAEFDNENGLTQQETDFAVFYVSRWRRINLVQLTLAAHVIDVELSVKFVALVCVIMWRIRRRFFDPMDPATHAFFDSDSDDSDAESPAEVATPALKPLTASPVIIPALQRHWAASTPALIAVNTPLQIVVNASSAAKRVAPPAPILSFDGLEAPADGGPSNVSATGPKFKWAKKKRLPLPKSPPRSSRASAIAGALPRLHGRVYQRSKSSLQRVVVAPLSASEWSMHHATGSASNWDPLELPLWLDLLAQAEAARASVDQLQTLTLGIISALHYWSAGGIAQQMATTPPATAAGVEAFEFSPAGRVLSYIAAIPVLDKVAPEVLDGVAEVRLSAMQALGPALRAWCELMKTKGASPAHSVLEVYAFGIAVNALQQMGVSLQHAQDINFKAFAYMKWRRAAKHLLHEPGYDFLAGYLNETKDWQGVLDFVREKWPKSMSTYLSCIRNAWMQLEQHCEEYPAAYADALSKVDKQIADTPRGKARTSLLQAKAALARFHELPLKDKLKVQKSIRWNSYSGVSSVDELIAALPLLPDHIRKLALSRNERDTLAKKATEALEKKSVNSMQIDASALIDKCVSILSDPRANSFDVACAIGLVSGRRMVEVFKTAEFDIAGKDNRTLTFSGQAKKSFPCDAQVFRIPTLIDSSTVIAALNKLRDRKPADDLSNKEVNLKWSNSANTAARRLLGDGHHFHDLRGIYAVIAFNATLPHTYSLNAFVAKCILSRYRVHDNRELAHCGHQRSNIMQARYGRIAQLSRLLLHSPNGPAICPSQPDFGARFMGILDQNPSGMSEGIRIQRWEGCITSDHHNTTRVVALQQQLVCRMAAQAQGERTCCYCHRGGGYDTELIAGTPLNLQPLWTPILHDGTCWAHIGRNNYTQVLAERLGNMIQARLDLSAQVAFKCLRDCMACIEEHTAAVVGPMAFGEQSYLFNAYNERMNWLFSCTRGFSSTPTALMDLGVPMFLIESGENPGVQYVVAPVKMDGGTFAVDRLCSLHAAAAAPQLPAHLEIEPFLFSSGPLSPVLPLSRESDDMPLGFLRTPSQHTFGNAANIQVATVSDVGVLVADSEGKENIRAAPEGDANGGANGGADGGAEEFKESADTYDGEMAAEGPRPMHGDGAQEVSASAHAPSENPAPQGATRAYRMCSWQACDSAAVTAPYTFALLDKTIVQSFCAEHINHSLNPAHIVLEGLKTVASFATLEEFIDTALNELEDETDVAIVDSLQTALCAKRCTP
ncbi:hypothetical protein JKP88DRAFT_243959 [Tribonema minus]|uniref:Telomere resolvase ResT/TelK catalytic domain-containing protein n=1 Tax=Tribonema minus TaxID=303371 RepID=A0A835Z6Q2_9STRA|nr:hypothetical protein JKP88DRAFT_243959 [Tribonema minus]